MSELKNKATVKKRGRKPGRPGDWKTLFLEALEKTGMVGRSAVSAGVLHTTACHEKKKDAEFARAWEDALDKATVLLEDEARRRATEGVDEPVFYQGDECGAIRRYSDTLLIFMLKGLRPEKYRERISQELSGPNGGPIELSNPDAPTLDARRAAVAGMCRRLLPDPAGEAAQN